MEERAFYAPIINYINHICLKAIGEITVITIHPIFFSDWFYRKIIEDASGETAYDKMTRKNRNPEKPRIELDEKKKDYFWGVIRWIL